MSALGHVGDVSLGGMSTFNMQHGFTEALVRGMRSGFLQDSDYHHLTQCENLEVNKNVAVLVGILTCHMIPSLFLPRM